MQILVIIIAFFNFILKVFHLFLNFLIINLLISLKLVSLFLICLEFFYFILSILIGLFIYIKKFYKYLKYS